MESKDLSHSKAAGGFTLIELLVTVGLIAVIIGGVGIALAGGGRGDVPTAERVLQGLLISARTQAVIQQGSSTFPVGAGTRGFGASALLLINGDVTDPERYLRETTVVYWGEDVDGNQGWLSATGFDLLPAGIHFEPVRSQETGNATVSLNSLTVDLNRPSAIAQSTAGTDTWHYIPFNSQGRLNGGIDEFNVVIASGSPIPGAAGLELVWDSESAPGGYIILGMGAVYRYPDAGVIP
ncbi:MAG: prepilin-type N-terminal cleavage/methylation domain-containing protein [Opitutales bacterium]|nr:prepilin-type N-terminal cleavage/methylation domain-containing protein [Opitutales bacterium]NRA26844.1 prepilin-type N-terminal cleavage/methylation domain-containing protein [Opitutales bacterium]